MARVQLITTGAMEERALGKSLRGFFPDHEFVSRPHLDGFTSARLPPTPPLSRVPLNLDKLAATLIGVFDPGNRRDRPRPDFVVVVEDVELANADDPARITAALRETLSRKLESWPANAGTLDRLREELQSKASFHLMAPMTEAYFFADTAATARPSTVSVPLTGLDWPHVTRRADHTRFARSLLADLSDMLGTPMADGETHPLTWPPPRSPVLRNL